MTIVGAPRSALGPPRGLARSWLLRPGGLALIAAVVRLPFLLLPLSPDEGGYLLVGSQWSPGTSTYGNYFVDRPPLLVLIFELADAAGGTVPLRLLGVGAVVAAVLLAGALGGTAPAAVAAIFLSTPLFDAMEVDGELLAVPFVLAGILLLVRSLRATRPRGAYGGAAAAGVLAACAMLVKQNMVDVVAVAAVLLVGVAARRGWRAAALRATALGAGGVATVAAAVAIAAAHGTDPAALLDALVTFRAEAAEVIGESANAATPGRFHGLLLALAVSGAPLVLVAAVAGFPRRKVRGDRSVRAGSDLDLRWAAVAVLAWELVGAVLGGSYWLHYLLALVPGLVLLTVAARPVRWRRWAIAAAAASTGLSLAVFGIHHPSSGVGQVVSAYLRAHSRPGDTVVVGFGHPEIVREAGLTSPYPHLWSLSARVRDPSLHQLTRVLDGSAAPRWVVVDGASLDTWGIDARVAQQALDSDYHEVTSDGDWHVFEHR